MRRTKKGEESQNSSQNHARKNRNGPKPGQEVVSIKSDSSDDAKGGKHVSQLQSMDLPPQNDADATKSIKSPRKHLGKRTYAAIVAAEENGEAHETKKAHIARRGHTYLRSAQRTTAQDPARETQDEFEISFGATNASQFDQRIKRWVDGVTEGKRTRSAVGQIRESGGPEDLGNSDVEQGNHENNKGGADKGAEGDEDQDGNASAEEQSSKDEQKAGVSLEREDDGDADEDEDMNDKGGDGIGDDDYVEEEDEEDVEQEDEHGEDMEDDSGSDEQMSDAQNAHNHQRPYQIDTNSADSGEMIERHRLTSRTDYLDRVEPGNTNPAREGFRRRMEEQGRHLNAYHWPNPVYYSADVSS